MSLGAKATSTPGLKAANYGLRDLMIAIVDQAVLAGVAASTTAGVSQRKARRQTNSQIHETADNYVGIVARLSDAWRVVVCRHGIQWILQRKDARRSGRTRWTGVRYFLTREALIRVSRTLCGRIDSAAMATVAALPDMIRRSK